ncbi:hypothetical protein GRI97_08085 [Altererythrobacter xixiisoli]|uniref:Uncharacterized protein n=1 Tax=Croceibacterium xixiisoli TaxID=1476466 RepID=A0A6I4TS24_9SPHN|nr:hypothetical protein [Croceibacterium xixiisoli]MXO98945.1 hypothetical protein [Croceibacterium xixiisoli]
MSVRTRLDRGNHRAAFDAYYRGAIQVIERAALIATDRGRRVALAEIRREMQAGRLGRLGNGIGSTSDLERGRGVYRRSAEGFSASGMIYVRSKSDRTRGAIEAYTEGAEIGPRRGRWLWIATDEIPRVTNRQRMTPELYRANGFEQKIGPLSFVRNVNGNPLLVAKNVGVSELGQRRKARSLKRSGIPRAGQRAKAFVVAFVGIPRTSRAARVDVRNIVAGVQAQLPEMFNQAVRSVRR